jgi:hypothetical protein
MASKVGVIVESANPKHLQQALNAADEQNYAFHKEVASDPIKKAKQIEMYRRQIQMAKQNILDKSHWIKFLEDQE